MVQTTNLSNDYMNDVEVESQLPFDIVDYKELLDEGMIELLDTNPEDAMSWGYEAFDNKLGYLLPGQLIILGGVTGTGKSTLSNTVAQNVSNQGIIVGKFTLEDRHQDRKKQELYYEIGRIRKRQGFKNYPINEFMINAVDLDENVLQSAKENLIKKNKNILEIKKNTEERISIDHLEGLVKKLVEKGSKLIVIDHLNEFKMTGDRDRNDLKVEDAMYKLKDIGRRFNVAIILIAHYKKLGTAKPNDESFKDSMAISQVANKVIHLYRDKLDPKGLTEVIITKNRDNPGGTGILELNYDIDTGTYMNLRSKKQEAKDTTSF